MSNAWRSPHGGLLDAILGGVTRATPEEEATLFNYHDVYGEVKDDTVYINEKKLEEGGSTGDYVDDMMFGEALHNLDKTSPYWYHRLRAAAQADDDVMQWKDDSYKHVTQAMPIAGESRPKEKWWDVSRFDQVVGGYLLGGEDANVHTMRNWSQGDIGFGTTFRKELEAFKKAIGR